MFDAQILTSLGKRRAGKKLSNEELCRFVQDALDRWDVFCAEHDADDDDFLDDFIDETVLALAGEDMDAALDVAELLDALVDFLPLP